MPNPLFFLLLLGVGVFHRGCPLSAAAASGGGGGVGNNGVFTVFARSLPTSSMLSAVASSLSTLRAALGLAPPASSMGLAMTEICMLRPFGS